MLLLIHAQGAKVVNHSVESVCSWSPRSFGVPHQLVIISVCGLFECVCVKFSVLNYLEPVHKLMDYQKIP